MTYNTKEPPTDNSFKVVVNVETADRNEVETRSCVTYTGDGSKSGMTLMEFGLPSGFSLDQDEVNKVRFGYLVCSLETRLFDFVTRILLCLTPNDFIFKGKTIF